MTCMNRSRLWGQGYTLTGRFYFCLGPMCCALERCGEVLAGTCDYGTVGVSDCTCSRGADGGGLDHPPPKAAGLAGTSKILGSGRQGFCKQALLSRGWAVLASLLLSMCAADQILTEDILWIGTTFVYVFGSCFVRCDGLSVLLQRFHPLCIRPPLKWMLCSPGRTKDVMEGIDVNA